MFRSLAGMAKPLRYGLLCAALFTATAAITEVIKTPGETAIPERKATLAVTLGTGVNDDPPYVYGSLETPKELPGVTIEILKRVEKKTGVTFNIKRRPWARVVRDVQHNNLDGGFHFSFKEKRTEFLAYPIPPGEQLPDTQYSISNRAYFLYRLKGDSIRWDGQQIVTDTHEPFILGAIRGGSITDKIKALNYPISEVETDQQLIELLLAGRIDAFVAIDNMIDPKIKALSANKISRIEKFPPPVQNKPYYIGFSKDFYNHHPEIAWQIWEAIKEIKQTGELTKIFEHYATAGQKAQYEAIEDEIKYIEKYRTIDDLAKEAPVYTEPHQGPEHSHQ